MGAKKYIDWAFLVLALLLLHFRAQAQYASVEEAINEITDKYKVHFLYSKSFLPSTLSGSTAGSRTLAEALDKLCKATSLEYTLNGRTVLLRPMSATSASPQQVQDLDKPQPAPALPPSFDVEHFYFRKKSFPATYQFQKSSFPATAKEFPFVRRNDGMDERHPVQLGPPIPESAFTYELPDTAADSLDFLLASNAISEAIEADVLFKYRLFNVSVAPGLGTNGLNPGSSYNGISVNLTVDYSAGSNIFGLAGFSNFSKRNTYGFQVAGVLNVVGGDMRQQKHYTKDELEELKSPFLGIQAAGLANLVTGSVTGFQGAAFVNVAGDGALGWQFGGLSNFSAEYLHGVQSAALFNYAGRFVTGVQLGSVNYAKGDLFGVQIGLLNRNKSMNGPNSVAADIHGLQLGTTNFSGRMGGYQIGVFNKANNSTGIQFGLANVSGESSGYHFGLVNVFKSHSGYAFGLINIGAKTSGRFWVNETFQANIGLTTGSEKVANTVFYSRNIVFPGDQAIWPVQAWGYGVSKGSLFNPHDLDRLRFKDIRINMSWVNFQGVDKQPFNLLVNPQIVYGRKLDWSMYFSLGAGINAWWTPNYNSYKLSYLEVATIDKPNYVWKFWPSLTMSIELMNW